MKAISYEDTNVQAAMLFTNALTSIGSNNEFLINNGNWVKKAENWTKFSIISTFGLVVADGVYNIEHGIHQGEEYGDLTELSVINS
jgi:hypothetical protein